MGSFSFGLSELQRDAQTAMEREKDKDKKAVKLSKSSTFHSASPRARGVLDKGSSVRDTVASEPGAESQATSGYASSVSVNAAKLSAGLSALLAGFGKRATDVPSADCFVVADGWYRLLAQSEGEFYNVLCPDNVEASIHELRKNLQEESRRRSVDVDVTSAVRPREAPGTPSRSGLWSVRRAGVPPLSHISFSDFTVLRLLGRGSFGKVVLAEKVRGSLARSVPQDTLFAIKIMKKDALIMQDDVECALQVSRHFAL